LGASKLSRGFRLQDARRRERRTAAQRKFGATIREGKCRDDEK
jgi:hypothetical protein